MTMPKTRVEYWTGKFEENVARDLKQVYALIDSEWDVLTVWECETRDSEQLRERLEMFLRDRSKDDEHH